LATGAGFFFTSGFLATGFFATGFFVAGFFAGSEALNIEPRLIVAEAFFLGAGAGALNTEPMPVAGAAALRAINNKHRY
jgi:hypothetical protein